VSRYENNANVEVFSFYILLTVHLVTIPVNNQFDALCNVFIYFTSLHVSSNPVLIIRRINCINTSSGIYFSSVVPVRSSAPPPEPSMFAIILVNNQLDALFNVFIYFTSLYVSSNPVLIIRRIKLYQYII